MARTCKILTCVLQAAVGEGQQRSVQGALGVLEDGIVLVDVLHHLRVELVLLQSKGEIDACDKVAAGGGDSQWRWAKNKRTYAFNIHARPKFKSVRR